ncbi:beta-1,3-glucanase family protein [Streptomyces sp. NPDC059918]|uniref:beta-1,3-glucanase family protein n=1 Tax=unclassified Streptomyces TaxID=2593676 RepID=UPI003659BDC2
MDTRTFRRHAARLRHPALRTAACAATLLALPVASLAGASLAHAAGPPAAPSAAAPSTAPAFTQSVKAVSGTDTVQFSFTPAADNKDSRFVDVHYSVKGAPEGVQSFRMTRDHDGTWTWRAAVQNKDFQYWYTYADAHGGAVDTGKFDKDGNPEGGPVPPDGAGTFPLKIDNPSGMDLYVTVVGQATPGHYSFLRPDGSLAAVYHPADPDGPDSDQKDGKGYPKMSMKLSDLGDGFTLPSHLEGSRIFLSDHPLYMDAAKNAAGNYDDSGYGQPDRHNPADPNRDTRYDFFEYTFRNGKVAFGGNTTQVDGFSLPVKAELKQESSHFDRTVGIDGKTAADVIAAYRDSPVVGGPFKDLVDPSGTRITAPRSATGFRDGGAAAHYFDPAIDKAWQKWADGFKMTDGDNVYRGRTTSGDGGARLSYEKVRKENGKETVVESGSVAKPSTADVAACAGTLAQGTGTDKFVEAHLCAAFNRGVALNDPATWNDASTYYDRKSGVPFNDYAAFFHSISIDGLAYAFAYDDVHDKSSVMILPNSGAPTGLTLTVNG